MKVATGRYPHSTTNKKYLRETFELTSTVHTCPDSCRMRIRSDHMVQMAKVPIEYDKYGFTKSLGGIKISKVPQLVWIESFVTRFAYQLLWVWITKVRVGNIHWESSPIRPNLIFPIVIGTKAATTSCILHNASCHPTQCFLNTKCHQHQI